MNLLVFPQYAYPTNHVVVNTVFEGLLPARGHVVHMIRPMKGVTAPTAQPAPWGAGRLIGYPDEPLGSAVSNVQRALRQRRYLNDAAALLGDAPVDAVLVRNNLAAARVGLRLARARGVPFLYQLSSPDAEFRIRQGRATSGWLGRYLRLRGWADLRVRRSVQRSSDVVLAISDAMRTGLIDTDRLDRRRVFSFPMGVNIDAATSAEPGPTDVPDGPVILYSGVLDPVRNSVWMLDVLQRVCATVADARLVVVTYQPPGDERRRLFEDEARRRSLAVQVIGPLSHRAVSAYYRRADVMLSAYPPMFEHAISSPTKSLEAMNVGTPVVGSAEVHEHEMVFGASGGGVCVPWDVEAFASAIVDLLSNPLRARAMGARGQAWVHAHRSYERLTTFLEQILARAGDVDRLSELPTSVEAL